MTLTMPYSQTIGAILLVASLSVTAQEKSDCNDPQTQLDMNRCAHEAYESADEILNAVYKATIEESDPSRRAKLQKAQQQWIKYRDANCHLHADRTRSWQDSGHDLHGSMKGWYYSECLRRLTEERTRELNDIGPMERP